MNTKIFEIDPHWHNSLIRSKMFIPGSILVGCLTAIGLLDGIYTFYGSLYFFAGLSVSTISWLFTTYIKFKKNNFVEFQQDKLIIAILNQRLEIPFHEIEAYRILDKSYTSFPSIYILFTDEKKEAYEIHSEIFKRPDELKKAIEDKFIDSTSEAYRNRSKEIIPKEPKIIINQELEPKRVFSIILLAVIAFIMTFWVGDLYFKIHKNIWYSLSAYLVIIPLWILLWQTGKGNYKIAKFTKNFRVLWIVSTWFFMRSVYITQPYDWTGFLPIASLFLFVFIAISIPLMIKAKLEFFMGLEYFMFLTFYVGILVLNINQYFTSTSFDSPAWKIIDKKESSSHGRFSTTHYLLILKKDETKEKLTWKVSEAEFNHHLIDTYYTLNKKKGAFGIVYVEEN